MAEFVRVAAAADVKPGQGIVAEANGKALAVFNVDGTIHAINNTCCHREGPWERESWTVISSRALGMAGDST